MPTNEEQEAMRERTRRHRIGKDRRVTCPLCGNPPDQPASDPVNGPRVPCCGPVHRDCECAYAVSHGARWINRKEEA